MRRNNSRVVSFFISKRLFIYKKVVEYSKRAFIIGGCMQVLKEKTKVNIDEAALKLFRAQGYKGVSMRQIAKVSEMTVGNIYRYYKNKDELFESLLAPSLEAIEHLVSQEIDDKIMVQGMHNFNFDQQMIHLFLGIHKEYSDELYILVHGCEGSRLGNTINKVSELLAEKLSIIVGAYNQNNTDIDVDFLSHMIAKSIIDNYIEILYAFDDDAIRQSHMLQITRVYTGSYITGILEGGNEV